ncbi:MAG: cyclodeaminase/cyclohydrolase family protein, partial [Lachnospiraceae bacterium]|nr:cyclodeaminase/cyclohydrolase family protein [Lachnospiraceae bacterium]
MLTEKTCRDFTEVLASNKPVPGGGGGAAMAGALAVSLCAMAGNFTVGKKKYADVEEEAKELLTECEELRIRLLNLVEADAEAFEPLSKAYSIPKDDPSRADRLEEATMNAIMAPLDIMDACADVIELLDRMYAICNRMM